MLIDKYNQEILTVVAKKAENMAKDINPEMDGRRKTELLALAERSRKLADDALKMNADLTPRK